MKIFIPPHIRKIGVVEDLCNMIIEYSNQKLDEDLKSPDYYYYYYKTLSYDSVKNFVGICKFREKEIHEEEIDTEILNNEINYITNLFYTVKGTIKVFDFLKKYLNINFINYNYDISASELYINLTKDTYENMFEHDEETFRNSFENFLKAVLYLKNLSISYSNICDLKIEEKKDVYFDYKYHNYTLEKHIIGKNE